MIVYMSVYSEIFEFFPNFRTCMISAFIANKVWNKDDMHEEDYEGMANEADLVNRFKISSFFSSGLISLYRYKS